jgi:hypothetical protein
MVTTKTRRLRDAYRFPGFRPVDELRGVFGSLCAGGHPRSALKKTTCGTCGRQQSGCSSPKRSVTLTARLRRSNCGTNSSNFTGMHVADRDRLEQELREISK